MNLGSASITALYLGSTAISTVYLGATQVYSAGGAFTPASLFASGEEGAWYEPSPTTAFLSTTDLTPCGYGEACGLLLDKSQGAGYSGGSFTGLGTELVTNGTFDTDVSGWSVVGGTLTWVAGKGRLADGPASGNGRIGRSIGTLSTGTVVRVSTDVEYGTASSVFLRLSTDAAGLTNNVSLQFGPSSSTEVSAVFVIPSTAEYYVVLGGSEIDGQTVSFDNISVRELPGNHATQTTLASRPILARVPETGRRNLLERTEEFDNAYWTKSRATITANAAVAPDGSTTADFLVQGVGDSISGEIETAISWSSSDHCFSIRAKPNGKAWVVLETDGVVNPRRRTWFNLSGAGSVGTSHAAHTASISLEDGYYTCAIVDANGANVTVYLADADNSLTVADDGNGVYLWGAQLELGSTATAYQKVVDEYDITEAGVTSLDYLSFDGTDDGMATASIDFTGVTELDIFAGVDALQGINRAAIFARYAGDNNNSVAVEAPSTTANQWGGIIRTGSSPTTFTSAYLPPQRAVLTITHDPASRQLRVDGTQTANQVAPSGNNDIISGVYGVGYRAGTLNDLPFDGNIYGLIIRGASSTTEEITNTEAYLAAKSGVTL